MSSGPPNKRIRVAAAEGSRLSPRDYFAKRSEFTSDHSKYPTEIINSINY